MQQSYQPLENETQYDCKEKKVKEIKVGVIHDVHGRTAWPGLAKELTCEPCLPRENLTETGYRAPLVIAINLTHDGNH